MKNTKKTLFKLLILTIVVLTITGCTQNPPNQRPQEEFFRGNEGIRLSFLQNMPPPVIYVGEGEENTFNIVVEAHNVGAITSIGNYYIHGFDSTLIGIDGIDVGRPAAADCDFTLDYFRDFSRVGAECNWGRIFGGSTSGEDWWSNIQINNVPWFEQACNKLSGKNANVPGEEQFTPCGWLSDLDLNVNYNNGNLDWQAMNDNLAIINRDHENGARFMFKGGMILGSFADGQSKPQVINGDNNYYPYGERTHIDFSGWVKKIPTGMTTYDPNIMVSACYLYATIANPMVCVDPTPYSNQRKACIPNLVTSLGGGQGAPVAITRIEQEIASGKKIFFKIFIENVGGGEIYDYYSINKCSPYNSKVTSLDKNIVYVEDIRLSDVQLKCTPNRIVRLVNGRGMVTCEFDTVWTDVVAAHETPLFIELGYAYRKDIEKRLVIKKI